MQRLTEHIKSSFTLDFPVQNHLQLHLTAVAEHTLRAATPPVLPFVPVCLNILAEAEQIPVTVIQQLFCISL